MRGSFLRRLRRSRRHALCAIPALFVLAHAARSLRCDARGSRAPVLLGAAAYIALVTASALRESRAERANPWLVGLGTYLTHLTYGSGTIAGLLRGERRPR